MGDVPTCANKKLLLIASAPDSTFRMVIPAPLGREAPRARGPARGARIRLELPNKDWFRCRVARAGLQSKPVSDVRFSLTLLCAALVSPGETYAGPLSSTWSEESRLLHEFYAFPEDAYNLHIQQLWRAADPIKIDFRRSWQGASNIAALTGKDKLFFPMLGQEDLLIPFIDGSDTRSLGELFDQHHEGLVAGINSAPHFRYLFFTCSPSPHAT